jgi:HlyD family secretion protein
MNDPVRGSSRRGDACVAPRGTAVGVRHDPGRRRRRPCGSSWCVVVAALALALGACSDSAAKTKVASIATFKVERRDLRATVSEKGTLKAANQILVRPEIPGQAKIVSLVEEGTQVKEGDILCELDRTDTQKQVDDLANRVIQIQGQLAAAEAELSIQLSQNEADIRDASLKHHLAELELDRFEKGEFVQEKTKRDVRVEESKSELDRATRRYDEMPALLKEGFVTQEQVEEERIKKVKAESEVLLARLDLAQYLDYAAPKDREQKGADVRNTALEVGRAEERAKAREAQKRAELDRQKSELANVKASLETAEKVLSKMTIRAPGPGLVIFGDARNPWDDREVKVGEMVYSGQPFLTLPDLTEMQVVVSIHEADISKLKPGQKAFVVVESANDTPVEGEVVKVAPVAAQQGRRWGDDVKRFNVDIALRGDISALKLKPGLTARVEIHTGEKKGALAVPAQAVFAERGKFYVFRRSGETSSRVEVEIEDGDSQFTAIRSGIEEGDEVLLYNPEAQEGAAAAAPAAPGEVRPKAAPSAAPGKP